MEESGSAKDCLKFAFHADAAVEETVQAKGRYELKCYEPSGDLVWVTAIDNVVATVGKNQMLDSALAGSAYTVTGPFLFLMNSSATPVAGDTMASHTGWTEFTAYSGSRPTAAWSSASAGAKALSSPGTFVANGSGTIGGVGMCYGVGATNTISNTGGILLSAGTVTAQPVISGNTVTATYTFSI